MAGKRRRGGPGRGPLYAGVDTHGEAHVLAVVDSGGARVATATYASDAAGCAAMAADLAAMGRVRLVAVEGCCSYGAGLAGRLRAAGLRVAEALWPGRRHADPRGKDDSIDAEGAARLARDTCAGSAERAREPKDLSGAAGELSFLVSAREAAVRQRTALSNRMRGLLLRVPERLRERCRGMRPAELARTLRGLRADDPVSASLGSLASLWEACDAQARDLEARMRPILERSHPALLAAFGVGTVVAATLVACAGDNPGRFGSEAGYARACGVAPLPASSGRTVRHRLSRGGDRRANRAIHQIAIARARHDPRTVAYLEGKRSEGKTRREALRCLARYIAREVYGLLTHPTDARVPRGASLRESRASLGLTQAEVAVALGTNAARISRLERGLASDLALEERYALLMDSGDPGAVRESAAREVIEKRGLQT